MRLTHVTRFPAGPAALLAGLCVLGCANGNELSGPLPSPDGALFVSEVYPLLLRDCAYVGCHGGKERFFQVYGPGRVRMPAAEMNASTRAELHYDDPANLDEVLHGYQRALSMLASADQLEASLLLRKPLELQAGGQGHKGVDELGRNVFASKQAPGWQLLRRWANSKGSPPSAEQVSKLNAAAALASEPKP